LAGLLVSGSLLNGLAGRRLRQMMELNECHTVNSCEQRLTDSSSSSSGEEKVGKKAETERKRA
jgi:hypothetical protein